jgi:two-component system, cell cycle sensor histidine kinase and response regulator CckA
VEDQAGIREVLSEALQRAGYTILQAADGQEALSLVKDYQSPIHLVITDLMMPNMGGRELVSIVAQLRPDIRTLYISGYAELFLPHPESSDPILQKPFSLTTLTVQVRKILDAARSGANPVR